MEVFGYKIKAEKIEENYITADSEIIALSASDNLEGEDSYKVYEDRLISSLNNKSVFNIALTGIYGSGKSSVLNTFKKKYTNNSQWNFLDISLSTFQISQTKYVKDKDIDLDEDNHDEVQKLDNQNQQGKAENTTLTPEQIQLIERSILQQFFYSVPQNEIPLSRFKRITEDGLNNKALVWLIILAIIIGLMMFTDINSLLGIDYELNNSVKVSLGLILFICSLIILYKILSFSLNLSEVKLNFHDMEFNIKNEENKSILNDHLDEILYFFKATQKNVVIIEDLDRFDNTEIFIRLRELNSLINKSCAHRVVFIYAIKDDMFKDSERSKFFEYIIPVIPIINPTNAYDLITKNYKNIIGGIDTRFLSNTCLYFDDMRLLKNILNEYQDFLSHLDVRGLSLSKEQLFAMIVYKNYHPNEFAKLNSNRGEIHQLFNEKKSELINTKLVDVKNEIKKLEKEKEFIVNERLETIEELNAVYSYYLNLLLSKINKDINAIVVEGNTIGLYEYNEETFATLEKLGNTKITYKYKEFDYYRRASIYEAVSEYSFKDVERLIKTDKTYSDRLKAINDKSNVRLKDIESDISVLNKRVSSIKQATFQELLNEGIEWENSISEQLKFFITDGYINENYVNYISLFVESSISINDKKYTLLVNARRAPDFELELKNIDEILRRFFIEDQMLIDSALNVSMLRFLLNDKDKHYKNYQQKYLQKICDKSDISNEFLNMLFSNDVDFLSLLVPAIANTDETVFTKVLGNTNDEQTLENYTNIIKYIGDDLQSDGYLAQKLSKFLSKRIDYINFVLSALSGDAERFKQFSLTIEPLFSQLDASDKMLFNWLGEKRFFAIDMPIIKATLLANLELTEEEINSKLRHSPITTILQSEIDYLIDNFWHYINKYIDLFLSNKAEDSEWLEDEGVLIRVITYSELSEDNVDKVLESIATKIGDITQTEQALYPKLFEFDVAQANWTNVVEYYKSCEEDMLSDELIEFLEINTNLLVSDKETYKNVVANDGDLQIQLEQRISLCNALDNDTYEAFIKVLTYRWRNLDFTELNKEKTTILIDNNKLSLNEKIWSQIVSLDDDKVRKAYIEHHILSIISNDEFINHLAVFDILVILKSSKIDNDQKQGFIESNIESMTQVVRQEAKIFIDLYDNKKMPDSLYGYIRNNEEDTVVQDLFLAQADYLKKDEILELLSYMGSTFQELAEKHPDDKDLTNFEDSQRYKKLLDVLHDMKIITKPKYIKKTLKSNYYETRLRK